MSIAREMAAQRESNIVDAWKNGGTFEGKPVTDEMLLAFYRQRAANVDRNDPLYEHYKNTLQQYDYLIHQSKEDVLYRQGKISAGRYAQFFLDWSKKVPRNSEFYRTLQKDAARFLVSARASSKAAADAAKVKAYEQTRQSILDRTTQVANLLNGVLTYAARDNQLIGLDQGLDKLSINSGNDPARLQAVIDQINSNPGATVYQDPNTGKLVTGQMILDRLGVLDPANFGTKGGTTLPGGGTEPTGQGPKLTIGYFTDSLTRAASGYQQISDLAAKNGYTSETKQWSKAQDDTRSLATGVGEVPTATAYADIIARRDRVWDDPNATGQDRYVAGLEAEQSLLALAASPTTDFASSNQLRNEAEAYAGEAAAGQLPTYGESFAGHENPTTGTSTQGDNTGGNAVVLTKMNNYLTEQDQLSQVDANGQPLFVTTTGTRDAKTGAFTFDPAGKDIGVASIADVTRSGAPTTVVMVPSALGPPIELQVVGSQVKATATDTAGQSIDINGLFRVTSYSYSIGGRQETIYQTTQPDGTVRWTNDPPWHYIGGARTSTDAKGQVTVDFSGALLQAGQGGATVAGLSAKTDTQGTPTGRYALDPMTFMLSDGTTPGAALLSDVSRSFATSVQAALNAAAPEDRGSIAHDPRFLNVLQVEALDAAKQDPAQATQILQGAALQLNDQGNLPPGLQIPPDNSWAAAVKKLGFTPENQADAIRYLGYVPDDAPSNLPVSGPGVQPLTPAPGRREAFGPPPGLSIQTPTDLKLPSYSPNGSPTLTANQREDRGIVQPVASPFSTKPISPVAPAPSPTAPPVDGNVSPTAIPSPTTISVTPPPSKYNISPIKL